MDIVKLMYSITFPVRFLNYVSPIFLPTFVSIVCRCHLQVSNHHYYGNLGQLFRPLALIEYLGVNGSESRIYAEALGWGTLFAYFTFVALPPSHLIPEPTLTYLVSPPYTQRVAVAACSVIGTSLDIYIYHAPSSRHCLFKHVFTSFG